MYRGIIVPLITPLTDNGAVSKPCVRRLMESLHGKVDGFMPALSSGEGWKLSEAQWRDMVAYTIEYAEGQPVLAGIQLPDTSSVIARSRWAEELRVDAIVVTTPFDRGLAQESIYEHYATLRRHTSLPIFIYNEAALSQNNIEIETLLRICRLPNVVGIKESSGSIEFTCELLAHQPGVPVFQGWENLLLQSAGVDGYVMPLANLDPALGQTMLAAPAAETQAKINAICEAHGLFKDSWYHGIKHELVSRGVIDTARVVSP